MNTNPLYQLELVKRRIKTMRVKKIIAYILGGFFFAFYLYTLYEYVTLKTFGVSTAILLGFVGLIVLALYCVLVISLTQSGVSTALLKGIADDKLNDVIQEINTMTMDNQFAYGNKELFISQRIINTYSGSTVRGILIRSMPRSMGKKEEGIIDFYIDKKRITVICKHFKTADIQEFRIAFNRDFPEVPIIIFHEEPKVYKQVRKDLKK